MKESAKPNQKAIQEGEFITIDPKKSLWENILLAPATGGWIRLISSNAPANG
ncbi:MAG TPA: hypothetical protein VIJ27_02105 [Mucilaginibacter sp.]